MFGIPSNKPLHASILNETLPYGHYLMDVLCVLCDKHKEKLLVGNFFMLLLCQNTATDNTKAENNAQALPETGEESSNTTLVTMIALVVLAVGSLLAFRRTSKSNK